MGGYWDTYVYAAMQQPTNTMTPLPLEGLHVRLPWTPPMLRNIKEAVIEYRNNPIMTRGPLPAELTQYVKSVYARKHNVGHNKVWPDRNAAVRARLPSCSQSTE